MSELLLELLFVDLSIAFDEILQLRQVVGQLIILSFGHCVRTTLLKKHTTVKASVAEPEEPFCSSRTGTVI
jgi:hypothetical protein